MGKELCGYDIAWVGLCKKPATKNGHCDDHQIECAVCKQPATRECDYTGQFVCGTPLCDNCEGYNETGKPSGAWGFMNHKHRTIKTPKPSPTESLSEEGETV